MNWIRNKKFKKRYFLLTAMILPIVFSLTTSNPDGTSMKSEYYEVRDLEFLYDLSYMKNGEIVRELSILNEELEMIENAEEFIIADLFLFNDEYDKTLMKYPASVDKITEALIAKKKINPQINIVFITDPINNFYGVYEQETLELMKENGIEVVMTELDALKDSNSIYSGFHRVYLNWFGTKGNAWISNPIDDTAPDINIRAILKLANFKANHRKIIVTDKEGLVTSANPHDPSSFHSNVAVKFKSEVINDMIQSEKVVANFSNSNFIKANYVDKGSVFDENAKMRLITEKEIFNAIKQYIDMASKGDSIQIGIFYMSDFDLIKALERASDRGVAIKIIADPNKDAFGIEKNGIPNRPVLTRLTDKYEEIQVRWYQTSGEQYHAKLIYFQFEEKNVLITGSGNFTKRNIKGFNLESNVEIVLGKESNVCKEIETYFDRLWNNVDGEYTLDFQAYKDDSVFQYLKYIIQESSGMGTF